MRKILSVLFMCIYFLLFVLNSFYVLAKDTDLTDINSTSINLTSIDTVQAYKEYIKTYRNSEMPLTPITVDLLGFTAFDDYATVVDKTGDKTGKFIQTKDDGFIQWEVNVENEGLYNIGIEYFPQLEGSKGSAIIRSLLIDGKFPFEEATNLIFNRTFTNKEDIKAYSNGNQIKPTQIETPKWLFTDIRDPLWYNNDPLQFYLTKGKHIIKLVSVREPMTIGNVQIYQAPNIKSYNETQKDNIQKGYSNTVGEYIKIQGENAIYKSDCMMYPTYDPSSPATQPSDYSKILLNTIGGSERWSTPGQWLSWDFTVKQSGFYKIGIKGRQNFIVGKASNRRLYIDNKIPFDEMNEIKFPYKNSWQMNVLSNGTDPYLVYLDKGNHTLKLEASLGEAANLIEEINDSTNILNEVYRSFLMITGSNPDLDRDYSFEQLLPKELKILNEQSIKIRRIADEYSKQTGVGGQQTQILYSFADQLKKMSEKPEKITQLFSSFVTNISALGSFVSDAKRQPVEVDYIVIASPNEKFETIDKGFFANFKFTIQQFVSSFYKNYSAIGDSDESPASVTVWIGSGTTGGRDQADVLNQMILDSFTSEKNIKVKLNLVPMGSLLSATLAKKGPDVALSLGSSDPMNYAIRNAVVDIAKFNDYEEIAKRFMKSSLEPLTFQGHVYGLPETQNFPMMFYRTDILEQLNISVPETWDDVIDILPALQKKQLIFGLPIPYSADAVGTGFAAFAMFLYQNGGELYKQEGAYSTLSSDVAIKAFNQWTNFYNLYGLDKQFDFLNRFRNGQMPICITDYGAFNQLSVFAPELNNHWDFAPVPGVLQKDGTINRTVAGGISACVIFENAKNKSDAWEFLKWWTSAESQKTFGRELESIMGTAARYSTANLEAFYQIPWKVKEFDQLKKQWEWVKGIPEVPGSYMVPRYIDFAVKQATGSEGVIFTSITDPGQILLSATELINSELRKKREEIGIVD